MTDGLPEATVGAAPLGYDRLHDEIEKAHGDLSRLFDSIARLSPGAHDDDWTAVVPPHS